MENLWATSTFQEDKLWYPKLDNALEVLGRGMVSGFSHPLSSIQSTVQLEVAYYNAKLALWELVIEPVGYISHTGHTHYSRWSLDLRYLPPGTPSCLQVCPQVLGQLPPRARLGHPLPQLRGRGRGGRLCLPREPPATHRGRHPLHRDSSGNGLATVNGILLMHLSL